MDLVASFSFFNDNKINSNSSTTIPYGMQRPPYQVLSERLEREDIKIRAEKRSKR